MIIQLKGPISTAMNPAEAQVVWSTLQAKPTIFITNLANPSIVYHNVDDFLKEIKRMKIPFSKTFRLSFEGGEDLAHPAIFIRINDEKIPRYGIQILFEHPVPHFKKLAEYLENKNLYWLIAYIEIYQTSGNGPVRKEGRIEQFFRRIYRELCEGNKPPESDAEIPCSSASSGSSSSSSSASASMFP